MLPSPFQPALALPLELSGTISHCLGAEGGAPQAACPSSPHLLQLGQEQPLGQQQHEEEEEDEEKADETHVQEQEPLEQDLASPFLKALSRVSAFASCSLEVAFSTGIRQDNLHSSNNKRHLL